MNATNSTHVSVSGIIDAAPEQVYRVMADYRVGHAAILPSPYFTEMRVLAGGTGSGTVVDVDMAVLGTKRTLHLVVEEPEPGKLLLEHDDALGLVTTFRFEPVAGGTQTKLTITTDTRAASGFAGWVERLINPAITRRIYRKELDQLNAYVRTHNA